MKPNRFYIAAFVSAVCLIIGGISALAAWPVSVMITAFLFVVIVGMVATSETGQGAMARIDARQFVLVIVGLVLALNLLLLIGYVLATMAT